MSLTIVFNVFSALLLLLQLAACDIHHGGITVRENSEDCELEISYLDIQFFCHNAERPAFYIGKGDFVAIDHLGNFDINDTITEKVNFILVHFSFPVGSFRYL